MSYVGKPLSLSSAEHREVLKGLLKFKGYEHNPQDSLKKFLYKTLQEYIHKYPTVTLSGREQCHLGARRSYGDLYRLCKFYYPEVLMSDIVKILTEDINEDIKLMPKVHYVSSYCGTILKQTHRFEKILGGGRTSGAISRYNGESQNEYGWKHSDKFENITKY